MEIFKSDAYFDEQHDLRVVEWADTISRLDDRSEASRVRYAKFITSVLNSFRRLKWHVYLGSADSSFIVRKYWRSGMTYEPTVKIVFDSHGEDGKGFDALAILFDPHIKALDPQDNVLVEGSEQEDIDRWITRLQFAAEKSYTE